VRKSLLEKKIQKILRSYLFLDFFMIKMVNAKYFFERRHIMMTREERIMRKRPSMFLKEYADFFSFRKALESRISFELSNWWLWIIPKSKFKSIFFWYLQHTIVKYSTICLWILKKKLKEGLICKRCLGVYQILVLDEKQLYFIST